MKKFFVAAAALAVALVGFGALGTATTQAAPTSIVMVNCAFLGGCPLDNAGAGPFIDTAALALTQGNLTAPLTASDLASAQAKSANQVSINGTVTLGLFAFVNDDSAITFDTGTVLKLNGGGDITCNTTTDATEADCDANGTAGDGVVGVVVSDAAATDISKTATINVTQGTVSLASDSIMVVGLPDTITLAPATATTQALSTADCKATDPANTTTTQVAFAANVTDNDGNSLVAVPVKFTSSDATVALVDATTADSVTPVLADTTITANSVVGIDAFAVACGKKVGTTTITATSNPSATATGGQTEKATAAVTVVGAPSSVALTASPAAIACDGTGTATVTAKVTDSAGNNAVDGTTVNFSVVALGTANPINAKTTAGTATSVITPLSGSTAGTVVNVSVPGTTAAASIRIDCLPSLATPPAGGGGGAGATPTPRVGVTPPGTGNGGYLGQDSSSGFPMWTLVALALGSFALVAGGMVTRRAGK